MSDTAAVSAAVGIRSREDVIALAQSLAKPVVQNMLPLDYAIGSIAAVVGRGCRLGLLDAEDPQGTIDVACDILRLNIEIAEDRRDKVISGIDRVLRPLIDRGEPIGRLRAEAHDVNADQGSPLIEEAVEQEIVHLLYQARAKAAAATGDARSVRRPRRYHG